MLNSYRYFLSIAWRVASKSEFTRLSQLFFKYIWLVTQRKRDFIKSQSKRTELFINISLIKNPINYSLKI